MIGFALVLAGLALAVAATALYGVWIALATVDACNRLVRLAVAPTEDLRLPGGGGGHFDPSGYEPPGLGERAGHHWRGTAFPLPEEDTTDGGW